MNKILRLTVMSGISSALARIELRAILLIAVLCLGSLSLRAQSSCSAPPNPIVAENCNTGTPSSVWDIGPEGDDPTLVGFGTDISVDVGQTISFKIDTTATAYTMEIYRIGYYGGMGARLITSITPSVTLPQTQPACLVDDTTNLVDCGNWAVSASWQVPTTATSGVYFVLLTRPDTGGQNHIVFVVRNDASTSQMIFQTSDESWQAYNEWQPSSSTVGHSLYGPTEVFDITNRAYKVSYNRPFHTRDFGDESLTWVFGAEYPMIRWLEANGYDVTYFTGMDADRYGSLIKNHKVYLSVGHDEYWSGNQFTNVQAARNAGVHLAFFSGNETFWKTRWENSNDGTNTPYRTLVCYKETYANAVIDPDDPPTWTGTWRDPRFSPPADGGRPENALHGTLFMVNGPGTDNTNLSIQVPQADGQMRFWRNTSVASLAAGQTATLPAGTLGYEWDEDIDNGFRPAGMWHLSTATYTMTTDLLLDYGETYGAGTATHHMTMYRAPSGALVFGAGTCQWSWGLDQNHDDPLGTAPAPSTAMQQATVNLFADMGVQPGTLQSGLTAATQSTDHTPPTSTITSPAPGASVQGGSQVTITGTAVDAGGGVVAAVDVSYDGGTTWHPATGRGSWSYVWTPAYPGPATIMSRAVDDSGNIETPGSGATVTATDEPCPCSIWSSSTTPVTVDGGDGSAIEVGVKFTSDQNGFISGIRFYKSAANTGTHIGNLWTSGGTQLASATFTNESASGWQQVMFSEPVPIAANTTYVASYHTTAGHYSADSLYFASGGANNPPLHALANSVSPNGVYIYGSSAFPTSTYNATNYWVDVVFDLTVTSTSGPAVDTVTPSNGATLVSTGSSITATFNESMNASTFNSNTFQLVTAMAGEGNAVVAATVSYNSAILTATLVPSQALAYNTTYTATLVAGANGVQDANGLTLSGNYTWSFTTGPPPGACPCTIWSPTTTPGTVDSGDTSGVELGVKFSPTENGFITGIRFYKATTNTGTHVGNLWTTGGTRLASATFTNESASGWQQVNFSTAVAVTANTTYVASYFAPNGHYSVNGAFFATEGVDNPPLDALANSVSPNGVYTYGSASAFPSSSYNSSNYWVDVVFNTGTTPTVVSATPASGSTLVAAGTTITATFNEAMNASTITANTFQLSGGGSSSVPATVTYNSSTFTATLVPTQALAYNSAYTVTLFGGASGVQDPNGDTMAANYTWTFTTAPPPGECPCTIWSSTTTPGTVDSGDTSGVEVGVEFTGDQAGYITGIRFYKATTNTGTHIGNLWTTGGTLLASAAFSNESASGWQQVNFSSPVAVTANTTYIASYYAPNGHYSVNGGYFASAGVSNPPLDALANSVSPNGVYTYGSKSAFPSSTYDAGNYWVDVVFDLVAGGATSPVVVMVTPAGGATGVSAGTSVTATFGGSMNASTITNSTFQLSGGGSNPVATTVSYNSSTLTATLVPTQPLAASTTYTATVVGGANGVQDPYGNGLATNYIWTFTTGVATPVTVVSVSPTAGATLVPATTSVTATFNEAMNASTINTSTFQLSGGGSNSVAATVSYNSSTLTATLVPTHALAYNTAYTATVVGGTSGVQDPNGDIMAASYTWTFTTAPAPGACPCTIWSSTTTPGTVDSGDGNGVEVGVKFTASENGYITGIRFYKATTNTGTHVGNLWTTGGTLLATATFTGETASGWQQVNFSSPAAVTANTTYIASYYAPKGHYSVNGAFFATAGVNNPPLDALANSVSPNGVYTYGSKSVFPSSSYNASNYWVDVVFNTSIAPTVTSVSPASGATLVATGTNVTATFNESMNASTINTSTFTLSSGGSNSVAATVSYNSSTLTATLLPTQALATSTAYTATVVGGTSGVQDPNGDTMAANYTWMFTTVPPPGTCPCTIWSSTTTPGTVDSGDTNGVEVGVKFTASESGYITGVRFYKATTNTGTHVGNLWTTGGTLLATATFTGETASGWQQVNFSSPVAVTANTTYVASYYAPNGHYSANGAFFATAGVNNPPLDALANTVSPNGVYTYGSTSAFPSSSYNATNYWVDVVFNTTP
jgi:hypothetical protein